MRMSSSSMIGPLFCPFSPKVSLHAKKVQAGSLEWLRNMGFELDESLMLGLAEVGFLVARAYPDADQERLQLASDWTTLFFLLDDLVEQCPDPNEVVQKNMRLMAALEGLSFGVPNATFDALKDIGLRLDAAAAQSNIPPEWRRVFNHRVEEWLGSHVWEANNRVTGVSPKPQAYMHMRQYTIGMSFEFALAEVVGGFALSNEERRGMQIQKLERHAANLIAWANDLLTVEKELISGDPHNLLISIHRHQKMTIPEAQNLVVNMHNLEMAQFVVVRDALLTSAMLSPAVSKYVQGLQNWIGGHLHWGIENKRYNPTKLLFSDGGRPTLRPE